LFLRGGILDVGKVKGALSVREGLEVNTLINTDEFILGFSSHPQYPVFLQHEGKKIRYMEGKKYGEDDGEYIKMEVDTESGEISIETDPLGRLPLYLYQKKDNFALFREVKALYPFFELTIDPVGMYEYLLFGYPLWRSTLFKEVKRVFPDFRINLNFRTGEFRWSDKNPIFETKGNGCSIEELSELLLASTARRSGEQNYLFLSGGMDSRLVGAALSREGVNFTPIFFVLRDGTYSEEREIARQLSRLFKKDLIEFEIQSNGNYIKTLARMKDGLNSAGAFMLHLFELLHPQKGVFFTGDGGDKVLPDLRPPRKLASVSGLIQYILEENALINPSRLKSFLKFQVDIREILRDLLENYQERDLRDKYTHFLMMERTYRWLFEGEDRNRYFLWSTSPFYAYPFFTKVMALPQKEKRHYRLFGEILKKIYPEVLPVPYSKIGHDILSFRARLYFLGREVVLSLPYFLKRPIKSRMKKTPIFNPLYYLSQKEMEGLLKNRLAKEFIDRDRLKETIERGKVSKAFGETLLFLLYYLDYIEDFIP